LIRNAFGLTSCLVLSIGLLWAANFWEEKPYFEWTEKETEKMLTDSPWGDKTLVGDTMVSGGSPAGMSESGGGRGGRRGGGGSAASGQDLAQSQSVTVRLHSATPVRMALAQRALLAGTLSPENAEEFIKTPILPPDTWSSG
jgi:hypothetical protein